MNWRRLGDESKSTNKINIGMNIIRTHNTEGLQSDQAMAIALERVPGQVVKAELDYDDGMLVYEIDVRTAEGYKYEVKIDANTGAILRVKLD